jgi:argininosuccinate lyase
MPQKRNPDVAELARGRAGRAIGDLVALLTALKGLPLAYDRDLQEDKGPVLDAVASVGGTIDALTALVTAARFDRVRLAAAAADPELYATDRAEALVARGIPFREAHEQVRASLADPSAGPADGAFEPTAALARRRTGGSPGPEPLRLQIAHARRRLGDRRSSLSSLGRRVEQIEELVTEETT